MLPDNGSTFDVLHLVYWASGVGLLAVQAYLLRFRRSAVRERHALRETVWAVVPALLLIWLGLLSHRTLPEVAGGSQIALEASSAGDVNAR